MTAEPSTCIRSSYPALLDHRAESEPDVVAVRVGDGDQLTYRRWRRESRAIAHDWRERGLGANGPIGLLFDNARYTQYAVAAAAAMFAGVTVVPLSAELADDVITRMLAAAGTVAVVGAAGSPARALGQRFERLSVPAGRSDVDQPPPPGRSRPIEILFTSGTTGAPKPVLVSGANIAGELPVELASGPRRLLLHSVPLGTNWGQVLLRTLLSMRTSAIVLPEFRAERVLAAVRRWRPSDLALSPAMAELLLEAEPDGAFDAVEALLLSSAPAAANLAERLRARFPAATIECGYTATEAWPAHTLMAFPPGPADTVGSAPEGVEVRVVDPTGRRCPPGAEGSVELRSPGVEPRRYLGGAPIADVDGWVGVGDVGALDRAGNLRLIGRESDAINVGGVKVHAGEVETVLARHPAVAAAAVVGRPAEVVGEEAVAVVVLREQISSADLRAWVRHRIGVARTPVTCVVVDALPLAPGGKVAKGELRRLVAAGPPAPAPPASPSPESVAQSLTAAWGEALELDEPALDASLWELGATSLTALAVAAELRERHRVAIPLGRFMLAETIAQQIEVVLVAAGRDRVGDGGA